MFKPTLRNTIGAIALIPSLATVVAAEEQPLNLDEHSFTVEEHAGSVSVDLQETGYDADGDGRDDSIRVAWEAEGDIDVSGGYLILTSMNERPYFEGGAEVCWNDCPQSWRGRYDESKDFELPEEGGTFYAQVCSFDRVNQQPLVCSPVVHLEIADATRTTLSIYSEESVSSQEWSHVQVSRRSGAFADLVETNDASEGEEALRASAQQPWGGRVAFTLAEPISPDFLTHPDTWLHFTVRDRRSLDAPYNLQFGSVDTNGAHTRFAFSKYVYNNEGFGYVESYVETLDDGYYRFHLKVSEQIEVREEDSEYYSRPQFEAPIQQFAFVIKDSSGEWSVDIDDISFTVDREQARAQAAPQITASTDINYRNLNALGYPEALTVRWEAGAQIERQGGFLIMTSVDRHPSFNSDADVCWDNCPQSWRGPHDGEKQVRIPTEGETLYVQVCNFDRVNQRPITCSPVVETRIDELRR